MSHVRYERMANQRMSTLVDKHDNFVLKFIFDRNLLSVAGICQPCMTEIATERRQGHLGKLTVSSTKHLNRSQSRVGKELYKAPEL